MPELFVVNGVCGGTVFGLPPEPTVVGRTPQCPIQIADPWLSSLHARLEPRNGTFWVVDLGSRNGTFVGEQRVTQAPLSPGARVRFGRTEAEFRATADDASTQAMLKENGTVVRYLGDFKKQAEEAMKPARRVTQSGGESLELMIARRQVAVMNAIGKALTSAVELDQCLAAILDTVFDATRAERGCLLLYDAQGQFEPRVVRPVGEPPRLSNTIIQAAVSLQAGLVTLDAQQDLRFQQSKSIVAQGIRSCLCVPIWAENRVLGALVLDRGFASPFSVQDLEMVTVAGYQAALAIERSRLVEFARKSEEQRKKLQRHFSPDVASMILTQEQWDKDPLEVSLRDDVTILFSDVKGFTSMTERMPPMELAALLKDYFREMTEAIFAEGGTLDKFIGDGIMAIFGAPMALPDAPSRAVRCAWQMLERLKAFNAARPPEQQLSVRIGINTGKVVAGNFGSPERLEFTVLGDTVNTASRFESIAGPNHVAVGRATFERTQQHFDYNAVGFKQVKGKAQAVEVFELIAPKGQS